jgi:acyl transferase domain-containing protein
MFRARTIPPNVNLNVANPAIKWDEYRLRVPLDGMPLQARHQSGRSLISMSSSGIGGANGHVVLEGPPESNTHQDKRTVEIPLLLIAGGLSPRSVASIAETLAEFATEDDTDMLSISTLYGRRSRQMTWRAFSILLPGRSDIPRFTQPTLISRTKPPLVFLFSGLGSQHIESKLQFLSMSSHCLTLICSGSSALSGLSAV